MAKDEDTKGAAAGEEQEQEQEQGQEDQDIGERSTTPKGDPRM